LDKRKIYIKKNNQGVIFLEHIFKTTGTCSRQIFIETDGDTIKSVRFDGGCQGNTAGIGKIVEDMKIADVIKKFKGIPCGARKTSCPDQLAIALEKIQNGEI
jgi:uncharacterized protein (TIGR03905 family)